jgi:hypothetical protein
MNAKLELTLLVTLQVRGRCLVLDIEVNTLTKRITIELHVMSGWCTTVLWCCIH